MEKKYTMKEFEEKFDNAVIITLEKILKDFENAAGEDISSMGKFAFSMQNTMTMCELKKILFEKGDN